MAGRKNLNNQDFERFLNEIIKGIDARENTEWEEKTTRISEDIRVALVRQFDALKDDCDAKFLDYCNTVKALLAIYNFGNLDVDEIENETAQSDRQRILTGVYHIIRHIEEIGYDITPYISSGDCRTIFGTADGKIAPLTLSATTVLTTLIYFRRAYRRKMIAFEEPELMVNGVDLMQKAVEHVAEILAMIVDYIESVKFVGWGFTFTSRAATLNDTYSVAEALGRFEDAFTQEDDLKRDEDFTNEVDRYGETVLHHKALISRAFSSVFKTAFNVYDRTKAEYGHNIFYSGAMREGDAVRYIYTQTDYDQIASSNRSSALFNPLYIAMITMYGYNEKEIVIRCFMDNYELAAKYYRQFETELAGKAERPKKANGEEKLTLSEYAAELEDFARYQCDFNETVKPLLERHPIMSSDYSDNEKWRKWYETARVFQKYLETQEPELLMKIAEYRDYFNATKDAIDQVQIMYRNFDNNQRLGIVDTDYIMFSQLDVNTELVNISKLNKSNIAVNYLRPMLLSSKIMIVKALTKYPQSDIENLFNAILEARYLRFVPEKNDWDFEWLWNSDGIDMNSTVRNCEAIAYDYFDYYEKYELGLRAINGIRRNIGGTVMSAIDEKTGAFSVEKAMGTDNSLISFKRIVLEVTRQNVELIRTVYKGKIDELQKKVDDLEEERNRDAEAHKKEMEEQRTALLKQRDQALEKIEDSRAIGDTLRTWIREETKRYLTETLSQIILNKLNGNKTVESEEKGGEYQLEKLLMWNDGEFIDANIPAIRAYGERLRAEVTGEKASEAREYYLKTFEESLALQELFELAFNGIFDMDDVTSIRHYDDGVPTSDKNNDISQKYAERLNARKIGKEYVPYMKESDGDSKK